MAYRRQFWWNDGQFVGEEGESLRAYEVTARVADGCHVLAPDDDDLVALQWGVLGKAHPSFSALRVRISALLSDLSVGVR